MDGNIVTVSSPEANNLIFNVFTVLPVFSLVLTFIILGLFLCFLKQITEDNEGVIPNGPVQMAMLSELNIGRPLDRP